MGFPARNAWASGVYPRSPVIDTIPPGAEAASPIHDRRTMTLPDVSVIIVSWNTRDLLRDCLKSLRGIAGVPIEVFVVDNDSQDGSATMVASEFPGVRLINTQQNRWITPPATQRPSFAHVR